ncbi:MAG: cell surface protein SprA, partial [Saprospiraceae bacterium]|nr:cell surface protein SprA [Saprospiraceae bacterium]
LGNAISPIEIDRINTDPSNDNFIYFSSDNLLEEFQVSNIDQLSIFQRYQNFNNQEGNSQVPEAGANRVTSSTNIPDSEDLNQDNTLNEAEAYYEYAIPMLNVGGELGSNPFITDVMESQTGKWYRFKIPVDQFSSRVGGIRDFRSIRFMRMYLQGFDERVTFRLARLDLVRNQWRRYKQELCGGDDIDQGAFDVSPVSIEENSERLPFNYVVPPGIQRENALGPYPNLRQNEQSLALDVCGLTDGCARAIYKTLNMDLRTFKRLKMFVHADSDFDYEDGDLTIFIRLGSDFNSNYYEYEIPLVFSDPAVDAPNDAEAIWKEENEFDLPLDLFKDTKILRNRDGVSVSERYSQPDPEKPNNLVHVAGNPNLGYVRTVMIGIRNPADDRETKCAEIWINELRLTGLNERSGVAGIARADFQLADFGSLSLAGNYS